jgi:hypothetical protein
MCPAIFSTLDWIVHFLVLPFSLSAYASVVVSRLYRFYDSKRDAWETIISMEDKLSRVDCPTPSHPWASACLNHPTQQLRYAGHLQAAQAVDAIHTAIEQSLQGAQKQGRCGRNKCRNSSLRMGKADCLNPPITLRNFSAVAVSVLTNGTESSLTNEISK